MQVLKTQRLTEPKATCNNNFSSSNTWSSTLTCTLCCFRFLVSESPQSEIKHLELQVLSCPPKRPCMSHQYSEPLELMASWWTLASRWQRLLVWWLLPMQLKLLAWVLIFGQQSLFLLELKQEPEHRLKLGSQYGKLDDICWVPHYHTSKIVNHIRTIL